VGCGRLGARLGGVNALAAGIGIAPRDLTFTENQPSVLALAPVRGDAR